MLYRTAGVDRARRYTFGGYAEASWKCPDPCTKGYHWASGAANDFLFRLGPDTAASYRPSGANTDYQYCSPGYWPEWGDGGSLSFGYEGLPLGANGRCHQGGTYVGAPNAACGGQSNWGATDMEVWYPVH